MRAVAACPVPVVSAVGHEQDTPLCDLAADVRASTPTAAGRLVVPDAGELRERLERARRRLARCSRQRLDRDAERLDRRTAGCDARRDALERAANGSSSPATPRRAPARARAAARGLERAAGRLRALSPRATLERGYAIVRAGGADRPLGGRGLRRATRVDVELAAARFGARVEETRP